MSEPRVRFVIGGVQKGGTTALARYLGAHPQVRLPRNKEAHVFDAPGFDEAWPAEAVDEHYRRHFEDPREDRLHGDATPIYLFHPRLVQRIARYNPAMRWIVLLRDPVDRAISHYHMERARGQESWPLWAAVLLERWRLRRHWQDLSAGSPLRRHSYRTRGDYARQLDVLFTHFPRDQVLLVDNSELRGTPASVMSRVHAFLDLPPPASEPTFEPVFEGHYLRHGNRVARRLLRWLMRRELAQMRQRYGIEFGQPE